MRDWESRGVLSAMFRDPISISDINSNGLNFLQISIASFTSNFDFIV